MKLLKHILLTAALMLALGQVAQANTVGTLTLTNCGTTGTLCPAATYNFNIGTSSATLTITINGPLTAGINDLIGGVNLGFTPSSTINTLSGSTSFGSGWSFSSGSLGNNGCGSNGGAFVCANFTSNPTNGGSPIVTGGTYSWTWNYAPISASSIASVGSVHVGANYNPKNGLIVSQTGATTTLVPEPVTLLMLGSGLIALGGAVRRMR